MNVSPGLALFHFAPLRILLGMQELLQLAGSAYPIETPDSMWDEQESG